ncbi:hypothetical protein DICPUDRAFT_33071 [Dictyostelium purpureum]|uniref:BTB domain-containing protein n=1 Tax=Dictyostelium purpureum TaxID=5786 RepID=F0ZK51_DICPU|nr:uncharacterized protein DICPUDRAFT_33071 [Dictyostelium purpureum]EGC35662.1 hypothetical protein DICPUDRAFT_33071 [Dictyostelium purpureum]|eukprot:XP_003287795.1 hypothetical protein DICPUDRAFT_33071 [Dictyostelium purpureum]
MISTSAGFHKSPTSLSSSQDESSNNGAEEDIIKLAKDLSNTFGILGDSEQPSQFSDVIFKVGGKRFFASKIMLVARSEYFKAMFTGSMKESSIKEITLEGVDPDVFFIVLKYICIGILDLDYDHRMVGSIYQYCDLLGLNRGKELSLATMTKIAQMYLDKPDIESALLLWDSLNQNSIEVEDVHPNLRAFILQYASVSLHCDAFYSICIKTLCDMLRNDGLRMEELDILDSVIDWCRENSAPQSGFLTQSGPGKSHNKRNSSSYKRGNNDDAESNGSCSSRCSSRRNSLSLKDGIMGHFRNQHNNNNNDCHSDTEETYSDIDDEEHRERGEEFDDDDDDDDEDDDFSDDDDKEDSANDDYYYTNENESSDIIEEWDKSIDKNLLNKLLPLIRWENMNIGEAFERLDSLKIIPDKEITNLLRNILKSNRGENFSFLGYHYRRQRNNRKKSYPIEFLLGMSQPFDSNVTNEIIPLNSSSEFGQSTNLFLYRIKKDIKFPANLERFTFKDREFFVQLKEREKGQLAVYLAFGSKLTKPLAISVLASIIGFRFQDSIEYSFKKMFDEGFDSAWGWPKFISLDALYKEKYCHYSDSFCLLLELTSQWG